MFNMVGQLSTEVREARDRVRTALKNSGFDLPYGRITVNFSPADRHKSGTGFDLAIAISLLKAMGCIGFNENEFMFIGELALDGSILKVNGMLPILNMAKDCGIRVCFIPKGNVNEAYLVNGLSVVVVEDLLQVIEYIRHGYFDIENDNTIIKSIEDESYEDFADILGQEEAKRAVMIAAAGWHNLLMIGPPGVGKSMIASRMPYIMDELTQEESVQVSNIHSICGLFTNSSLIKKRPYAAPHHSASVASIIGGGYNPKPGLISIANKGILFLDELPEFKQNVIDSLRQPLESKRIMLHRLSGDYVFPADCLIVAAMNPCKCGYYPDRNRCSCSINEVKRYLGKISGPMMDRMDMCTEVSRVLPEYLQEFDKKDDNKLLNTKIMNDMVLNAINFRKDRQGDIKNSLLNHDEIHLYCKLGKSEKDFMKEAYIKFNMSMRSYYKSIKVARTIADLEGVTDIGISHLAEALGYRLGGFIER